MPAAAFTTILLGQVMLGAWLSFTVTVKEQVEVFPCPSLAVAVTVVVPKANVEPETGLYVKVAVPQLSVAVAAKVTTWVQRPAAAFTLKLAGQVMLGAWLSFTVTVKEQAAVLPWPSLAVAVTVVVPKLNTEPEAGL